MKGRAESRKCLNSLTMASSKKSSARGKANDDRVLKAFRHKIQRALRAGNATEHTHRPFLQDFVESLGPGLVATNEPKRIACGAPDYVVTKAIGGGPFTLGHIEAKDVGTDLATIHRDSGRKSPKTRDGRQLRRYREALPNLVLTDYLDFRWYVEGELRLSARLGAPDADSKIAKDPEGEVATLDLLRAFFAQKPQAISSAPDLARRLAQLTHLIRASIGQAFELDQASENIRLWYRAFQEILVPDLSRDAFADMFSQTLSYGLFAARCNHPTSPKFKRERAARYIPKTNPFLRRLFDMVTGIELEDEPFVGFVDDVAQTLALADMGAVLADFGKSATGEDPVMHFYQTFLREYDPDLRERRGVYYTPEPVVEFIVSSIDELLQKSFGCSGGVADSATIKTTVKENGKETDQQLPKVLFLDPGCGTGTFLYSVVDRIRSRFMEENQAGQWPSYVREQLLLRLFGFELLMAPYAVAHLKLGMQLAAQDLPEGGDREKWAYEFDGDDRLGVYLTNTLDEAEKKAEALFGKFIAEEANAAARIKRDLPILVVLGNPPYRGISANRSEIRVQKRDKDGEVALWKSGPRKGNIRYTTEKTFIGRLMDDYYYVDGERLGEKKVWLKNDYVKFLRFAQWRIERTGVGIIGFITDHSFLDNVTFRGMRQQLLGAFDEIYILNLHGNKRRREVAPDGRPDGNVFDIQEGTCIGIFVRTSGNDEPAVVRYGDRWGTREEKYDWLRARSMSSAGLDKIDPVAPFYFFVRRDESLTPEYERGWKLTEIFPVKNTGIITARDPVVVDLEERALISKIADFRENKKTDAQLRTEYFSSRRLEKKYARGDTRGWKLPEARRKLREDDKWKERGCSYAYRPFDRRVLYYVPWMVDWGRPETMSHIEAGENLGLYSCRQIVSPTWSHALVTDRITDDCYLSTRTRERGYIFPLYLYPEPMDTSVWGNPRQLDLEHQGKDRWPNLSKKLVEELAAALGLEFVEDGRGDLVKTFGPEDLFAYLYAVLYSPAYSERYADPLKSDFPRVPFTTDVGQFATLCRIGYELLELHLLRSPKLKVCEDPLKTPVKFPAPGDNLVDRGYPKYLGPGELDPLSEAVVEDGRVYINGLGEADGQYFDGVSPQVWAHVVAGYQVAAKWLDGRKNRVLSGAERVTYQKVIVAIAETRRLQDRIDAAIPSWPIS